MHGEAEGGELLTQSGHNSRRQAAFAVATALKASEEGGLVAFLFVVAELLLLDTGSLAVRRDLLPRFLELCDFKARQQPAVENRRRHGELLQHPSRREHVDRRASGRARLRCRVFDHVVEEMPRSVDVEQTRDEIRVARVEREDAIDELHVVGGEERLPVGGGGTLGCLQRGGECFVVHGFGWCERALWRRWRVAAAAGRGRVAAAAGRGRCATRVLFFLHPARHFLVAVGGRRHQLHSLLVTGAKVNFFLWLVLVRIGRAIEVLDMVHVHDDARDVGKIRRAPAARIERRRKHLHSCFRNGPKPATAPPSHHSRPQTTPSPPTAASAHASALLLDCSPAAARTKPLFPSAASLASARTWSKHNKRQ